MRTRTWRRVIPQLVLLSLGLVLFGIFIRRIDLESLEHVLDIKWIYISIVLIMNLLVLVLKSYRWNYLLSLHKIDMSFLDIFVATSSGFFMGLVSPATAGELARIANTPIDKSTGIATILYEKLFDFAMLFLLSLAGVLIIIGAFKNLFLSFVVSFIIVIFMSVVLMRIACWLDSLGICSSLILNRYVMIFKSAPRYFIGKKVIVLSSMVSLLMWIVPGVQLLMICLGLGISVDCRTVLVALYTPYLLGVLSMLPLGVGVFELGTSHLLMSFGNSSEQPALIAVTLFRALSVFPLVLFGFICFLAMFFLRRNLQGNAE